MIVFHTLFVILDWAANPSVGRRTRPALCRKENAPSMLKVLWGDKDGNHEERYAGPDRHTHGCNRKDGAPDAWLTADFSCRCVA
jgi:hypothetical protein